MSRYMLETNSRFSEAPSASIQRSKFKRSSTNTTTFNAGDLIPIYCDEVLPGDTFDMRSNAVVRMATPISPVMDDAYMDTFWFYVPSRILWDHWKEFMGENTSGPWTQTVEYSVPQVMVTTTGSSGNLDNQIPFVGTLWNYFGLPIWPTPDGNTLSQSGKTFSVSALPFRAYVMIWNEFFRDENVDNFAYFYSGDSDIPFRYWTNTYGHNLVDMESVSECVSATELSDRMNSALYGGLPLKVNKFHDYFTSCLPQAQKGNPVGISLEAPVTTYPATPPLPTQIFPVMFQRVGTTEYEKTYGGPLIANSSVGMGVNSGDESISERVAFANLQVSQNPLFTISELRTAFQIQKLLEAEARGGTRYRELLYSLFGVVSPDSRMQVPEYLGGTRQMIGMQQVVQTSSTDSTTPQGNVSAYSLTSGVNSGFSKSFTEHGYVIGLCCVRTNLTYQQGINRMWSRQDKYDYYFPQLANISEQPVYNKEIYAGLQGGTAADNINDKVFGYQEAWAEYRYKPSIVTGYICSDSGAPLDNWTYAQNYNSWPTLSQEWLKQGTSEINRTLAVGSNVSHQFIADFNFDLSCTRPMPLYSIPGLADHH